MTFEEKVKEMLTERGMWPAEAVAVLELVKADKANEAMQGRWTDDIEGYPQVILNVLWVAIKSAALEYIDANCPKAWYRPLFTDQEGDEMIFCLS